MLGDGYSFLEGPRWHDGRLFVSDFYTHRVLAFGTDGGVETICEVPKQPSGLGFMPDGTLMVVSMVDRRVLCLAGRRLVEHADLCNLLAGPANDMVVDARGRAYVGSFGAPRAGGGFLPSRLVRVDPDGAATVVAAGLAFPNGVVLTQQGRELVVAETYGSRLTAFQVASGGGLASRRVWAALDGDPRVKPDGLASIDDGVIWVADAAGGAVRAVAEGGRVRAEVLIKGWTVYAVAIGGTNEHSLFLCAAPSGRPPGPDSREARLLVCDLPETS